MISLLLVFAQKNILVLLAKPDSDELRCPVTALINRVRALDRCQKFVYALIKFCICIDKNKIHVVSNAHCFWLIFNRVMALDRHQNVVYAQYLVN